ncbi:MAG: aldolase [Methanimicrococcus sp.]|nr:aldolase [Methanimicrococcus sp.]
MWEKISEIGKKLVTSGLVEANFGNLSIRSKTGCSFVITKTKTALDEIQKEDVIEVPIDTQCEAAASIEIAVMIEKTASSETNVHRRIYQESDANAIVHAHCPYAVVLSLLESGAGDTSIFPIDSEGKLFLKEIPIVTGGIGSDELAKNAAAAFKEGYRGVIVLGHGTIAVGETLKEAYQITAQLEHACKVKYMVDLAKNTFSDFKK